VISRDVTRDHRQIFLVALQLSSRLPVLLAALPNTRPILLQVLEAQQVVSVGHYSIICISMFLMPVRKALRSKAYAISRQGYQCGVPMQSNNRRGLSHPTSERKPISFSSLFCFYFPLLLFLHIIIFFFEVTSGMVVLNSPFDFVYTTIVDYKIFSGKQKL
jgi:hypothetical protein